MDPLWLLLLLPLAAVSGWLSARREQQYTKGEDKGELSDVYFRGLNLLINEQPDQALKVFLDAVTADKETVELHLALGSLFRRRGEIARATTIHQNLAARADLSKRLRELALFELAQDYFKAGLLGRAENLFQRIRHVKEHREQANRFLLQIYDQEKEWESAISIGEELMRKSRVDLSACLAQYCCELVEKAIIEGQNKRAADSLRAALRYDSRCVRAIIQRGRLAAMRGEHAEAIANWRELEKWAPEALGEAVGHIKNSYAALGDEENYRRFLEGALRQNADWRIIAAWVELAKSDVHMQASQKLLLQLAQKYPSMGKLCDLIKARAQAVKAGGRSRLAGVRAKAGASGITDIADLGEVGSLAAQNRQDFSALVDLMLHFFAQQRGYRCQHCGFNSDSLHWQCPSCKSWGSIQQRGNRPGNEAPPQLSPGDALEYTD